MPGGIGDTAAAGGISTVAIIAIAVVLVGLAIIASQSSLLRRRFDRLCGHHDDEFTEGLDAGTSGDSDGSLAGDPTRPAAGWPGFDPSFYGTPAGFDHGDLTTGATPDVSGSAP